MNIKGLIFKLLKSGVPLTAGCIGSGTKGREIKDSCYLDTHKPYLFLSVVMKNFISVQSCSHKVSVSVKSLGRSKVSAILTLLLGQSIACKPLPSGFQYSS